MPSPVFALKGRNSDPGVTNVRNTTQRPVVGAAEGPSLPYRGSSQQMNAPEMHHAR
jgi:hypothetical protein